jgi:hypothetical protein
MQNFGVPLWSGLANGKRQIDMARFRGWSPPTYLIHDIVQRVGAVDGEAHKDEVGFGVRQRTEAVVLFLAGGVP